MKKLIFLFAIVCVVELAHGQHDVKSIYDSQVGIRELTGHNDGKAVEMYLHAVNLGKGNPWCAAFVKWNYDQAGIKTTINGMALSVHRPGHFVYFKGNFTSEPVPGDAFTLYFPSLGRIGHTGFYDGRINTSVFKTVEGNTNQAGSREGDGVYRKYRSFHATYSISRWAS